MRKSLRSWPFALAAASLLAGAALATSPPFSVADLQRLLQQAPARVLRFQETRESPWLAAPVESSGRLSASATLLEKVVEQPRRETWRILPDRLERIVPGATEPARLLYSDSPAVAALAETLRHVMAGDLRALEKNYSLALGGDLRLWTVQLTPRNAQTARFLKQLDLQGNGAQLRVIVMLEPQGERTITRLSPEP
jgi:hypothetical protein